MPYLRCRMGNMLESYLKPSSASTERAQRESVRIENSAARYPSTGILTISSSSSFALRVSSINSPLDRR